VRRGSSRSARNASLRDLSVSNTRKEDTMSVKQVGSALALIFAGALFSSAQAAPISGAESTKRSMAGFSDVEKTQVYVYGGRRYCFYVDAWNGPGWYRCGYGWREGYGWGGYDGWRGWSYRNRGHRGPRYSTGRSGRSGEARGRGGRDRGSVGRSGRSDSGGRATSGRSGGGNSGFSGGGRSDGGGGGSGGGGSSTGGGGRSR
jgi:hypothetical protein